MEEFGEIEVENKLHIIISVKDFRAILQHAQSTSGALAAKYSNPGRPMKLQYEADGIMCEFILMTVGEKDATAPQKMKNAKKAAMPARPVLEASSHRGSSVAAIETQQPPKEAPRPSGQHRTPIRARQAQFEIRPPPIPPPGTARSEGLFVTQDEDDQQWDPANSGDEEDDGDNARLEWDASAQPVRGTILFPSNPPAHQRADPQQFESTMRINSHLNTQVESRSEAPGNLPTELEPTQRLSDVRRFGLFSPG
jgi:cell cycle checkpoint control protein RAD9A